MSFLRHDDYWNFCHQLRYESRFILSDHCLQFLEAVKSTLSDRIIHISANDKIWWRAQLGYCTSNDPVDPTLYPFQRDRMYPKSDLVGDGRANTRGVACLYLASDKETAMAEVRPAVGDLISCGQFLITEDVRVVDCRVFEKSKFYFDSEKPDDPLQPADPVVLNDQIWSEIDYSFSEPAGSSPSPDIYLQTQVLSEFFKKLGFDGIGYKSRLGKGLNLALFNLAHADMTRCDLFELESVKYQFKKNT